MAVGAAGPAARTGRGERAAQGDQGADVHLHLHLNSLSQLGRLALAFVLTYLLGFERDLRGSPAGDRTFSLIGVGSAIVAVLAKDGNAPNALAGVITGVGFIGAGVVFRPAF